MHWGFVGILKSICILPGINLSFINICNARARVGEYSLLDFGIDSWGSLDNWDLDYWCSHTVPVSIYSVFLIAGLQSVHKAIWTITDNKARATQYANKPDTVDLIPRSHAINTVSRQPASAEHFSFSFWVDNMLLLKALNDGASLGWNCVFVWWSFCKLVQIRGVAAYT